MGPAVPDDAEAQRLAEAFRLSRLAVLLAGAPDLQRLEGAHGGDPLEGSRADQDRAAVDDPEMVAWISLLSRLWISASHELLRSLSVLIDNAHRLNHTPRPLLRGVLEHAARALWVVDAETTDGRAARAWLARYVGILYEEKIRQADQGATGAMAQAHERLGQVGDRIEALFGERPRGPDDRPGHHWELCGERYGGSRSRIRDLLDRTFQGPTGRETHSMWLTLSHLTHPSTTGLLAETKLVRGRLIQPPVDAGWLVGTTLSVLAGWSGALAAVLDYHGWHHPRSCAVGGNTLIARPWLGGV